ncbi:RAC-alpha serine/threonine-protein kinase [Ancistrocladus abbreviatus]
MNRPTFLNILQANAGGGTTIVNNLLEHMKDEKNPIMEKIVEEIENIVGQGRTDLLTLYFAALRGEGLSVNASRRNNYPARVTISCSYKAGKSTLILILHYFKEWLKICEKTFGFLSVKIFTEGRSNVNSIEVIRD